MLSRIKSRRGFSLIELAVVLIIIGVIAAIAIPTFQTVITKSQEKAAKNSIEAAARQVVAVAPLNGNSSGTPSAADVSAVANDALPTVLTQDGTTSCYDVTGLANYTGAASVTFTTGNQFVAALTACP